MEMRVILLKPFICSLGLSRVKCCETAYERWKWKAGNGKWI